MDNMRTGFADATTIAGVRIPLVTIIIVNHKRIDLVGDPVITDDSFKLATALAS